MTLTALAALKADCFVDASEELFSPCHAGFGLDESRVDSTAVITLRTNDRKHPNGHPIGKDVKLYDSTGQAYRQLPAEQDTSRGELRIRLEETRQILRMALSNEFVKALQVCDQHADHELYASLANATLCFIRTALTMESSDLQAALHAIQQSFEVSSQLRRKSSAASMMMRLIYKPNYNLYTDDEIHAELVHAESLLLLALISFLADQSIICLVKGAFRIRTCYQRYKECLYIMETRDKWASEEAKCHFESGVRMGHGIFNLLMSYLPRRVLRFLEYVGFSGNRSIGIEELEHSVSLDDGLRSVFSALVILTYHSYVENFFGLGHYDAPKARHLNETFLAHYPNSAFFLLFLGRYYQMEGQLDAAIESFERCIRAQDDWRQFHSICHWEIMWCYMCQLNWAQAAHYSNMLRKQSKWSQASYTYQYGTLLYAQLVEDHRKGSCPSDSSEYASRMEEICKIMTSVPKLRVRYAGKTIPAEKFAITRSIQFLEQANRLTLPALEYMYIWNVFSTLTKAPKHVEGLLARIQAEIDHLNDSKKTLNSNDKNYNAATITTVDQEFVGNANDTNSKSDNQLLLNDDLGLLSLLRGMCLKLLNRFDEAEDSFMQVINNEHLIKLDTFLVPHTAMELAVMKISNRKQYDQGRHWIKVARQNYTGYLLETIVHFRLHSAMRVVRLEQQDLELSVSNCESPIINKEGRN